MSSLNENKENFYEKDKYFLVDRNVSVIYDKGKQKRFGFERMKEEQDMPLVTSKEMLLAAQRGGYAVGAFNAENMEMVKAIIQAAEELRAPVMIQTTPSTVKYGTLETYAAIVAAEGAKKQPCRCACTWIMAAALRLLCRL